MLSRNLTYHLQDPSSAGRSRLGISLVTPRLVVPSDTPIVSIAPGERTDLKPGAKIFIVAAKRQADGTLLAPRVNIGKDGLTPPM